MKNKKAEQISAKQRHRELLKAQRRKQPSLERASKELVEKPLILIICEGEQTEPSYFNQFRITTAKVKAIGEGYNTVSLVNRALQLSVQKNYDQVWCVFDKDDFSNEDFNESILEANRLGFRVAYSNQAFEYWLILHFDDHQGGGLYRKDYHEKINSLLRPFKISYDGKGSKVVDEDFFGLLDGINERTKTKRVDLAMARAERNLNRDHRNNPALEESSTTVFELVRELLKYK